MSVNKIGFRMSNYITQIASDYVRDDLFLKYTSYNVYILYTWKCSRLWKPGEMKYVMEVHWKRMQPFGRRPRLIPAIDAALRHSQLPP